MTAPTTTVTQSRARFVGAAVVLLGIALLAVAFVVRGRAQELTPAQRAWGQMSTEEVRAAVAQRIARCASAEEVADSLNRFGVEARVVRVEEQRYVTARFDHPDPGFRFAKRHVNLRIIDDGKAGFTVSAVARQGGE